MADLDTYTHLPLTMDPQTKQITGPPSSRTLTSELAALNAIHSAFKEIELPPTAPAGAVALVPPPPVPVNPKRSAAITKLRDQGNAEYRKSRYSEAIQFYTQGLEMALSRPLWEPQGLVREEAAALYANRAQARMGEGNWVEGAQDAWASVECKRVGNSKAWWRRGKCLAEMGRRDEAREWITKGLEVEAGEQELVALLKDLEGDGSEEKK